MLCCCFFSVGAGVDIGGVDDGVWCFGVAVFGACAGVGVDPCAVVCACWCFDVVSVDVGYWWCWCWCLVFAV